MRNICRVDHEAFHMHCWRVVVRRHSRTYRKTFSDGRYGGSEQALQAAQCYRDALIQAHPPLSRLASAAMLSKNNHSGISGLTRVDRVELSSRPQRRLCWEAHCPMGQGRATRKRFSIRKYGEEGAYQRALAAREAALHALAEQKVSPAHTRTQRIRLLAMRPHLRCVMGDGEPE